MRGNNLQPPRVLDSVIIYAGVLQPCKLHLDVVGACCHFQNVLCQMKHNSCPTSKVPLYYTVILILLAVCKCYSAFANILSAPFSFSSSVACGLSSGCSRLPGPQGLYLLEATISRALIFMTSHLKSSAAEYL